MPEGVLKKAVKTKEEKQQELQEVGRFAMFYSNSTLLKLAKLITGSAVALHCLKANRQ